DTLSASISGFSSHAIKEESDVLLYIVDITRSKGLEENRMLGVIRNLDVPKILVFNKIDKEGLNYRYEYEFLRDEFEYFHEISALNGSNVNRLLDTIFEILPEKDPIIPLEELSSPLVNIDRRQYLEEIIREKVYLLLRQEIPYSITVRVNRMEDKDELLLIDADIVTSVERYKGMIIGKGGEKIKSIGQAVRKELETITNRKIFVKLDVVVDPHWVNEWL
ncbi:KH domain-containing protein, partial [candidate division WWE3 bacterium]|nr:KH domain-containing protein [candidate division WWE3 bacterium]